MDNHKYMKIALQLAKRAQGLAEPNPMVGCVIVKNNNIIAKGYHQRCGQPHAEINALNNCQKQGLSPQNADAYITLEPCSHHGKTPPCADALIKAGIKRAFIAMQDPFPQVAGQGIAKLKNANIEVNLGLCEKQAEQLNEPYLKRINTQMPWTIAKWAQTIDGYIATSTKNSKWISNEQSRKTVHKLRARVDAIIIGLGTVLADNPSLTARDVTIKRTARRVVIDKNLDIPTDCNLITSLVDPESPPLTIAISQSAIDAQSEKYAALQFAGIEIIALPPGDNNSNHLNLKPLLHHLSETHLATNVLIEGGSSLLGSFIKQKLLDQALVYIAPKLLADQAAIPPARGLARNLITEATNLTLHKSKRLGDDIQLDYRFK